MYGKKIRALRVLRGYSQEYMSKELNLDSSKYSRIETDTQKPTAEMLEEIANLLGVSTVDLRSEEPLIFQNSASAFNAHGNNDHYQAEQKALYEKIIASQKEEIERLVKSEERLMAMLEKRK